MLMIKNVNIPVIDSFTSFLTYQKRSSEHTVRSYLCDIFQFYDFLLTYDKGLKNIEEASYTAVRAWIISLVELKLQPRSINRKLASLRSFYKFLCREGKIKISPIAKVQPLKTKKTIPYFIEEDKMDALLSEIEFSDTFVGLRDRLIIELLYSTGIRLAELLGLQHKDINLADKTIKVLGKRNKERIVPIPARLQKLIQSYIALKQKEIPQFGNEQLIVTNTGKPAYPKLVYRVVKAYLQLVTTIDKKSPHVLRHTFATHLLNHGADLNAIKELLGHANLAATQIYTHNSLEKLKNIFDQAHPKA